MAKKKANAALQAPSGSGSTPASLGGGDATAVVAAAAAAAARAMEATGATTQHGSQKSTAAGSDPRATTAAAEGHGRKAANQARAAAVPGTSRTQIAAGQQSSETGTLPGSSMLPNPGVTMHSGTFGFSHPFTMTGPVPPPPPPPTQPKPSGSSTAPPPAVVLGTTLITQPVVPSQTAPQPNSKQGQSVAEVRGSAKGATATAAATSSDSTSKPKAEAHTQASARVTAHATGGLDNHSTVPGARASRSTTMACASGSTSATATASANNPKGQAGVPHSTVSRPEASGTINPKGQAVAQQCPWQVQSPRQRVSLQQFLQNMPQQQQQHMSQEQLEQLVQQVRLQLIKTKQHAGHTRIKQEVLKLHLELRGDRIDSIPAMQNVFNIEQELNAFMYAYVACRPMTTLADAEAAFLAESSYKCESFDKLNIGPLLQVPVVVRLFRPADTCLTAGDEAIWRSVTTSALFEEFVEVLLEKDKLRLPKEQRGPLSELADLLKSKLVARFNAASLEELCVHIQAHKLARCITFSHGRHPWSQREQAIRAIEQVSGKFDLLWKPAKKELKMIRLEELVSQALLSLEQDVQEEYLLMLLQPIEWDTMLSTLSGEPTLADRSTGARSHLESSGQRMLRFLEKASKFAHQVVKSKQATPLQKMYKMNPDLFNGLISSYIVMRLDPEAPANSISSDAGAQHEVQNSATAVSSGPASHVSGIAGPSNATHQDGLSIPAGAAENAAVSRALLTSKVQTLGTSTDAQLDAEQLAACNDIRACLQRGIPHAAFLQLLQKLLPPAGLDMGKAAEELLCTIAGQSPAHKLTLPVLAWYWRHDVLVHMLLLTIRYFLHKPGAAGRLLQPGTADSDSDSSDVSSTDEDEAAIAVQPAKPVVHQLQMEAAVLQFWKGHSFEALAALEQQLLSSFHVRSLEELQLPAGCSTLASALQQCSEPHQLSGWGNSTDVGLVSRSEVLRVVQAALQNLQHCHMDASAVCNAVSACICAHFKTSDVLRLGYGPMTELIKEASHLHKPRPRSQPHDGIHCWAALALTKSGANGPTCSSCSELQPQQALNSLETAPLLADLSTWTDWPTLYAPAFGTLPEFLISHMIDVSFLVLELPGGVLLKLPAVSEDLDQLRAGWQTAIAQGQAELIIGLLLAHIIQTGGLAAARDLTVLSSIFQSLLSAALPAQSAYTPNSTSRNKVVQLVLRCLQLLPVPLAASLAHQVLIQSLITALGCGAEGTYQALLAAAAQAETALLTTAGRVQRGGSAWLAPVGPFAGARQRLHTLGCMLGIQEWKADCFQHRMQPAAQPVGDISGHVGHEWLSAQPDEDMASLPPCLPRVATADLQEAAARQDAHDAQQASRHITGVERLGSNKFLEGDKCSSRTHTVSQHQDVGVGLPGDAVLSSAITAQSNDSVTDADVKEPGAVTSDERTTSTASVAVGMQPGYLSTEAGLGDQDAGDETVNPRWQLINSIREQWGFGSGPGAKATSSFIHINFGSAVERLAGELYSSDVHFVLELLQNADDNSYGLHGPAASLELVLTGTAVTLLNNEMGFTEENVRSITRVGGSSKTGRPGYTGQKGIGFKSVFRVSNQPEIHSNGYHFSFSLPACGQLGYVVPTWLSGKQQVCLPLQQALQCSRLVDVLQHASKQQQAENGSQQQGLNEVQEFDVKDQQELCLEKEQNLSAKDQQEQDEQKSAATEALVRPVVTDSIASAVPSVEGCDAEFDNGGSHPTDSPLPHAYDTQDTSAEGVLAADVTCVQGALPGGLSMTTDVRDSAPSEEATGLASYTQLLGPGGGLTAIHMPLREDLQENVQAKLQQLKPTLLLFLRKLRRIIVTDITLGKVMEMQREELGDDVVRLTLRELSPQPVINPVHATANMTATGNAVGGNHVSTHWLLVNHTFSPQDTQRLGKVVLETAVSIAFGLDGDQPAEQQVYAFLPVRQFGLKFMVQADFVVPSHRTDLDLDNAWNQLLRSKVPRLFAAAFDKFKTRAAPTGKDPLFWLDWWLRCVPLPEHGVHEFFASLPHEVATHLKVLPCIPVEVLDISHHTSNTTDTSTAELASANADTQGSIAQAAAAPASVSAVSSSTRWVLPSQALVCTHPQLRALFPPQQLQQQGRYFVHTGVQVLYESKALRDLLGVGDLDSQQVIDLVKEQAERGGLQAHLSQLGPQKGMAHLQQLLLCIAAAPSELLTALWHVCLLPLYGKPLSQLQAAQPIAGTTAGRGSASEAVRHTVYFSPMPVSSQNIGGLGKDAKGTSRSTTRGRRPPTAVTGAPASEPVVTGVQVRQAQLLSACSISLDQLAGIASTPAGTTQTISQPTVTVSQPTVTATTDAITSRDQIAEDQKESGNSAGADAGAASCLAGGLMFIDPALLQMEDPTEAATLRTLLKKLGVQELTDDAVMEGYVMPSLEHWAHQVSVATRQTSLQQAATHASQHAVRVQQDAVVSTQQGAVRSALQATGVPQETAAAQKQPQPQQKQGTAQKQAQPQQKQDAAQMAISEAERKQLVGLLTYPLLSGKLSEYDLQQYLGQQQQQQQQQGGIKPTNPLKQQPLQAQQALIHRLARTAVLVTYNGAAVRPRTRTSSSPSHTNNAIRSAGQPSSKLLAVQQDLDATIAASPSIGAQPQVVGSMTSQTHGVTASDPTAATAAGDHAYRTVVYLPKQLGNPFNLPQLFPSHAWTLLSNDYLSVPASIARESSIRSPSTEAWCLLFTALGAQVFLPIEGCRKEISRTELPPAWAAGSRGHVEAATVLNSDINSNQPPSATDTTSAPTPTTLDGTKPLLTALQFRALASNDDPKAQPTPLHSTAATSHAPPQDEDVSGVLAFDDWGCPGFQQLLHSIQNEVDVQKRQAQMLSLLEVVIKLWPQWKTAGYLTAQHHTPSNVAVGSSHSSSRREKADAQKRLSAAAATFVPGEQQPQQQLPSSFLLQLQQLPWLLGSDGAAHRSVELFMPTHEIVSLFGKQGVPYLRVPEKLSREEQQVLEELADTMRIQHQVTLSNLLLVLCTWSSQSEVQPMTQTGQASTHASEASSHTGGVFVTSLSQMRRVYQRLSELITHAEDLPEDGFAQLLAQQAQHAQHAGPPQQIEVKQHAQLVHQGQEMQTKHQQETGMSTSVAHAATTSSHTAGTMLEAPVIERLQACQAFLENPLIWLPDPSALAGALAARAAAASAYDDYGSGYGSSHGTTYGSGYGSGYGAGYGSSHGPGRGQNHMLGAPAGHGSVGQQARRAAMGKPGGRPAAVSNQKQQEQLLSSSSRLDTVYDVPLPGKFYTADELSYLDESRTLETIHHLICLALTSTRQDASSTAPASSTSAQHAVATSTAASSQQHANAPLTAPKAQQPLSVQPSESKSQHTGAPRVLSLYYPDPPGQGLSKLFMQQLVCYQPGSLLGTSGRCEFRPAPGPWLSLVGRARGHPTHGAYCAALQALVGTTATDGRVDVESKTYQVVWQVMSMWSEAIASGRSREASQQELKLQLMAGGGRAVFPGSDGCWVSLSTLVLADHDVAASLFAEVPGVTFLQLPTKQHGQSKQLHGRDEPMFSFDMDPVTAIQPLCRAMGIPFLSNCLQQLPPCFSPSHPLTQADKLVKNLAAGLPLVQRKLLALLGPLQYLQMSAALAPQLQQLKCYEVQGLEAVFALSVPQRTSKQLQEEPTNETTAGGQACIQAQRSQARAVMITPSQFLQLQQGDAVNNAADGNGTTAADEDSNKADVLLLTAPYDFTVLATELSTFISKVAGTAPALQAVLDTSGAAVPEGVESADASAPSTPAGESGAADTTFTAETPAAAAGDGSSTAVPQPMESEAAGSADVLVATASVNDTAPQTSPAILPDVFGLHQSDLPQPVNTGVEVDVKLIKDLLERVCTWQEMGRDVEDLPEYHSLPPLPDNPWGVCPVVVEPPPEPEVTEPAVEVNTDDLLLQELLQGPEVRSQSILQLPVEMDESEQAQLQALQDQDAEYSVKREAEIAARIARSQAAKQASGATAKHEGGDGVRLAGRFAGMPSSGVGAGNSRCTGDGSEGGAFGPVPGVGTGVGAGTGAGMGTEARAGAGTGMGTSTWAGTGAGQGSGGGLSTASTASASLSRTTGMATATAATPETARPCAGPGIAVSGGSGLEYDSISNAQGVAATGKARQKQDGTAMTRQQQDSGSDVAAPRPSHNGPNSEPQSTGRDALGQGLNGSAGDAHAADRQLTGVGPQVASAASAGAADAGRTAGHHTSTPADGLNLPDTLDDVPVVPETDSTDRSAGVDRNMEACHSAGPAGVRDGQPHVSTADGGSGAGSVAGAESAHEAQPVSGYLSPRMVNSAGERPLSVSSPLSHISPHKAKQNWLGADAAARAAGLIAVHQLELVSAAQLPDAVPSAAAADSDMLGGSEVTDAVGRAGERAVYDHLLQLQAKGQLAALFTSQAASLGLSSGGDSHDSSSGHWLQQLQVMWLNEHHEWGQPYDLLLYIQKVQPAPQQDQSAAAVSTSELLKAVHGFEHIDKTDVSRLRGWVQSAAVIPLACIEVKTTTDITRMHSFQVSAREYQCAQAVKHWYQIWRVCRSSVLTQGSTVQVYTNPAQLWLDGAIHVTMRSSPLAATPDA